MDSTRPLYVTKAPINLGCVLVKIEEEASAVLCSMIASLVSGVEVVSLYSMTRTNYKEI